MKIALCAAAGAVTLGATGFLLGASVKDERAGEAATMLGWIGVAAGAALGALGGALWSMR